MNEVYFRNRKRNRALYAEADDQTFHESKSNMQDDNRILRHAEIRFKKKILLRRIVVLCIAILVLIACINNAVSKPMKAAAQSEAKRIASEMINRALLETSEVYSKSGGTAGFTRLETGSDGTSFLYIDSSKLTKMAAEIIERAQIYLNELSALGIGIPLGTLSCIEVLNGTGPEMNIAIRPMGSVRSSFSSYFSAAGVNQTKYSAFINIEAEMMLIISGRSISVSVQCSAPIVETVIVGSVPHAYTDVGSLEDALNLIPTDAD